MGKITGCTINYWYRDTPVYRPGESVCGDIILRVKGELDVEGISVQCYGAALSYGPLKELKHRFKEWYVRQTLTICEKAKMKDKDYKFTFQFDLPSDGLPSSFEGSEGTIKYWLHLCVNKAFVDFDKLIPITVLGFLEVDKPAFTKPVSTTISKTISKVLGLGYAGELHLSASLDRGAYCPGETMLLNVTATNKSTQDLGNVRIYLMQSVTLMRPPIFKGPRWLEGTRWIVENKMVGHMETQKLLGKQDTIELTNQPFEVPKVPPSSNEQASKIIIVSYFLHVLVNTKMTGYNLSTKIPVVIGTVPAGAIKMLRTTPRKNSDLTLKRVWLEGCVPVTYKQCTLGIKQIPYLDYYPFTAVCTPHTDTASSSKQQEDNADAEEAAVAVSEKPTPIVSEKPTPTVSPASEKAGSMAPQVGAVSEEEHGAIDICLL